MAASPQASHLHTAYTLEAKSEIQDDLTDLEAIYQRLQTTRLLQTPYELFLDDESQRSAEYGNGRSDYLTFFFREQGNDLLRLRLSEPLKSKQESLGKLAAMNAQAVKKKITFKDYKERNNGEASPAGTPMAHSRSRSGDVSLAVEITSAAARQTSPRPEKHPRDAAADEQGHTFPKRLRTSDDEGERALAHKKENDTDAPREAIKSPVGRSMELPESDKTVFFVPCLRAPEVAPPQLQSSDDQTDSTIKAVKNRRRIDSLQTEANGANGEAIKAKPSLPTKPSLTLSRPEDRGPASPLESQIPTASSPADSPFKLGDRERPRLPADIPSLASSPEGIVPDVAESKPPRPPQSAPQPNANAPRKETKVKPAPSGIFATLGGPADALRKPTATNGTLPKENLSKLVKIKYGKSQASRVQQLLKLPQPRKPVASPTSPLTPRPSLGSGDHDTKPSAVKDAGSNGRNREPSHSLPKTVPANSDEISRAAWKEENERQTALGKSLKREMDSMLPSDDKATRKLAAAKGIESLACWLFAFSAQEKMQPQSRERLTLWGSLQPFTGSVAEHCSTMRQLHGFALMLRSIVATGVVDAIVRLSEKKQEDYDNLVNAVARVKRYNDESSQRLSRELLTSYYPNTAAACGRASIGAITSPVVAARVALVFLGEWTSRQNVAWKPLASEGICSKL